LVVTTATKLIHEVIPVGWLQCNCSILGDPETSEAVVVDPGDNADEVLALLRRHNLKTKYIVVTHAHIDHVGGLAALKQATGAPILLHPDDRWLYQNLEMQAAMIGMPAPQAVEVDQPLGAGDELRWGRGLAAQVLHTPGHTPGSISLYMPAPDKLLFAGDTLFAGSIGRTDLWGGSYEAILRSIHTQLLALEDSTRVYPGHGPVTTIGLERERNPFLQGR
jgi:glyoxylase-like metal-dependent hydrolase (beta-lactamase superfamily II)